jgi:exosome complex RNA-binding protein Rrp4
MKNRTKSEKATYRKIAGKNIAKLAEGYIVKLDRNKINHLIGTLLQMIYLFLQICIKNS